MDAKLEELVDKLQTRRDELRVKLNLGKRDVADAWEEIEDDWKRLEVKIDQLGHDVVDNRARLREDVRGLAKTIQGSLSKVRRRFVE